jgi:hypothetical protein
LVFNLKEGSFYGDGHPCAFTFGSIVSTLVSCEVADTHARHKREPRCTPWYDEKDAGVLYLVRSANTSRFN